MVEQVNTALLDFEFITSLVHENRFDKRTGKYHKCLSIFIYGKKNLKKWMDLIGFSNLKHYNKFENWVEKYSIEL